MAIVLSASVRSNLLSLQSTADLLATTQNRLSTGQKVNSALDNPTNYFTARSLDARASDISNLLDGISNGVQVLQSANTGINSLNKLVDSAKSIANQALQTTVGYSEKSNVSTTITGATQADLRGTTSYASATALGSGLVTGTAGGTTAVGSASRIGGVSGALTGGALALGGTTAAPTASTTLLLGATTTAGLAAAHAPADGDVLTVNGKTITFKAGAAPAAGNASVPTGFTMESVNGNYATDGNGNSIIYLGTAGGTTPEATVGDLMAAIDLASGVKKSAISGTTAVVTDNVGQSASTINGTGQLVLQSSTGADLNITGKADLLKGLGLTAATGGSNVTVTAARSTGASTTGTLIETGSQLFINGKTITFSGDAAPAAANVADGSGLSGNVVTDGTGNSTVYLQGATVDDVLKAIDFATGVRTAVNDDGTATVSTTSGLTASSIQANGQLKLTTGTAMDLTITGTGNALSALGLAGSQGNSESFVAARSTTAGSLEGKTLTFTSFKGGDAVNITFGDGNNGTVKSLNDLNKKLAENNMIATLDANGKLTISAGNDFASSTLGSAADGGAIGGTATSSLTFSQATAPVVDAAAQATRGALVNQYNNILQQINSTALDASFNGVNLLNGDQLKLVFNETGKSTLNITGVKFDSTGLGLADLTVGSDFIDNAATNKVLDYLNNASSTLRSQASTLGSNLSVVQNRQSFNKELINVLQTGSSNLTLADTNEEAANSQALNTRQSIAVSALGLANQAQQSVLQLLR